MEISEWTRVVPRMLLAMLLVAACDTAKKSDEGAFLPVSGTFLTKNVPFWTHGECCYLELSISEEEGVLSGTGVIVEPGETQGAGVVHKVRITGTRSDAAVELDFQEGLSIVGTFSGDFSITQLKGDLSFLSLPRKQVILTKQ